MSINNLDSLLNSAEIDSANDSNNFLTDAVLNPIGAVEAVAANVGVSFYNLAALTPLIDRPIKEEELVSYLTNKGFQDAATYTQNHPQATNFAGLIAGGILPGRLGATAIMKLLGRGEVLATDGASTISKVMERKQALKQAAEEYGVASQPYIDALKGLRRTQRADSFIEGAANIGFQEAAMSQSYALKDTDYKDTALAMAIGGAASVALGAIPKLLAGNTEASTDVARMGADLMADNRVVIPHQMRGNLGEAVFLQAQDKAFKSVLQDGTEVVPNWLADNINKVGRISKARQIELVDQATHKEIRVTQGASRETPGAPHYELDVRNAVLNNLNKDHMLAGARNIDPFNADKHTYFVDPFADLALAHGLTDAGMERLQLAIHNAQQRGWNYTRNASVNAIVKNLKLTNMEVSATVVDRTHQLMNTVILDPRTQLIHGLEEGQAIATARDLGIDKVVHGSADKLLAGQVQFNNFAAIREGSRLVKDSLKVTQEELDKASYADLLKMHTASVTGKVAEASKINPEQITKALFNRAEFEISKLRTGGASSVEIAMRLHLDHKLVEDLQYKAIPMNQLLLGLDEQALKQLDQRALAAVRGDGVLGHSASEMAASIDNEAFRSANKEFLMQASYSSESAIVNSMFNLTNTGLGEGMRVAIRNLNPALYTGRGFGSADFAFRAQGETVNAILDMGASAEKILRDKVGEVTHDSNRMLANLKNDDFLRTEWNKSEVALRGVQLTGDEMRVVQGKELGVLSPSTGEFTPLKNAAGEELGELPKEVLEFWQHFGDTVSTEVRHIHNFQKGLLSQGDLIPRGIHLPPVNLTNRELAYAIDPHTNKITMYYANSKKALLGLAEQAKRDFPERDVITEKSDLERFNLIHDHVATGDMKVADFNKAKTSTTYDSVSAGGSQMEAFVQGNTQYLLRLGRKNMRLMNPEVTSALKIMNSVEGEFTSLYRDLEKTAFGGSILSEHKTLSKVNDAYTMGLNTAIEFLDGHFGDSLRWVKSKSGEIIRGKANNRTPQAEYERVVKAYEERGYNKDQLPWHDQIQALAETDAYKSYGEGASKLVSTNSFLASALALRFADLSHALVTTLSIPITTLPEASLATAGAFAPMKFMMEGVRRAFHPAYNDTIKVLEQRGIINPEVSEANNFIANQLTTPRLTQVIENNAVFHMLQKPSEWAEKTSRRVAAGTASAIYDAQHGAGAHLSADGISFISAFTKRTMGNYTASQRPAIFQGTFGASIGLFQTYVWTMGQMLFRGLESGRKLPVGMLLGSQAAVFGLRSLPGYDILNHYVGTHYGNDENVDISTTVYEGLKDKSTAEAVLYGGPSMLMHTSLWTRGIVNPRSPFVIGADGTTSFTPAAAAPIVNAIGVLRDTGERIAEGAPALSSLRSALQLQTISRPVARISDLIAGHSIDRRNGTVDPDAGFKYDLATFARLVSSRPLSEQLTRDLGYQQNYYKQANSFNKQRLMKALRVKIQSGDDNYADELTGYMNLGGSISGFYSGLNKIYLEDREGKMGTLDDNRLKLAMTQYAQ